MANFGQAGRPWTPDELAQMEAMLAEKKNMAEIARALGRNRSSVYERRNRGKPRKKRVRLESAGQVTTRVPPEVEEARAIRINAAPRDLTGAFFGDPPVGFSALERRS